MALSTQRKSNDCMIPKSKRVITALCSAALAFSVIFDLGNDVRSVQAEVSTKQQSLRAGTNFRAPKEADGCYHVYLDVGANIGIHSRFLYEPEKYPSAGLPLKIFNDEFGNPTVRDNRDFCVFEFEPNPNHRAKLQANQDAYRAMGWRYHVHNVAASDRQGNMTFYHQGDDKYNEWGFSLVKREPNSKEEVVPMIRLSDWIKNELIGRIIPTTTYGNYEGGPKVVMKTDIEASEYAVLPDLMMSGALCEVNVAFGEFHPHFAPINQTGQEIDLSTAVKVRALQHGIKQVIQGASMCKTRFIEGDSEAYLLDGMPYPQPDSINSTQV
eukprot:scaffold1605_cov158-Amphora_coffeaeformis.AAC.15